MKRHVSLLALLLLSSHALVQADTTIPLLPPHYDQVNQGEDGGSVTFHGSVYASPCVLAPESRFQVVELGAISARSFHQLGDRGQSVPINVEFRDCLKGAAQARDSIAAKTIGHNQRLYTRGEQAVQMTLMGDADENNSQLLHLTGRTTGAGIRILDAKQRPLDLGQTQSPFLVKSGDSRQTFHAVLESTGQNVTAGDFSGLLRLKMEYQ